MQNTAFQHPQNIISIKVKSFYGIFLVFQEIHLMAESLVWRKTKKQHLVHEIRSTVASIINMLQRIIINIMEVTLLGVSAMTKEIMKNESHLIL